MNPNTRRLMRLTVPGLVIAAVLVPSAASAASAEDIDTVVVLDQAADTSADVPTENATPAPADVAAAVPPADVAEPVAVAAAEVENPAAPAPTTDAAAVTAAAVAAEPVATAAQAPEAAATATPPVALTASVVAQADTVTERVVLHAAATNNDTKAARIVFSSSYGQVAFDGVAPGATVSGDIQTGQRSVAAGSVTLAAHIAADASHAGAYTNRTLTYAPSIATVAPRGRANGNGWVHPQTGHSFLAGYFVNTGGDPVVVRLLTPYGDSEQQTVAPGAAAYLTVDTGKVSVPAGTMSIRAYKYVDGRGYAHVFDITHPELTGFEPVKPVPPRSVTPAVPTWVDPCGVDDNGTWKFTDTADYTYTVRTFSNDKVQIKATPADGVVFPAAAAVQWQKFQDNSRCLISPSVRVTQPTTDVATGAVTIDRVEGIASAYVFNGAGVVSGKPADLSRLQAGTYTVIATPAAGYAFGSLPAGWKLSVSGKAVLTFVVAAPSTAPVLPSVPTTPDLGDAAAEVSDVADNAGVADIADLADEAAPADQAEVTGAVRQVPASAFAREASFRPADVNPLVASQVLAAGSSSGTLALTDDSGDTQVRADAPVAKHATAEVSDGSRSILAYLVVGLSTLALGVARWVRI